jgi:hypothetical protein
MCFAYKPTHKINSIIKSSTSAKPILFLSDNHPMSLLFALGITIRAANPRPHLYQTEENIVFLRQRHAERNLVHGHGNMNSTPHFSRMSEAASKTSLLFIKYVTNISFLVVSQSRILKAGLN